MLQHEASEDSEALRADSAALQEDSEAPHAQPEGAEAVQGESQLP